MHVLYYFSYRLFSDHLLSLLAMGDAVQMLGLATASVPPPIWWGVAPQLGAYLHLPFFGGRTLLPPLFWFSWVGCCAVVGVHPLWMTLLLWCLHPL